MFNNSSDTSNQGDDDCIPTEDLYLIASNNHRLISRSIDAIATHLSKCALCATRRLNAERRLNRILAHVSGVDATFPARDALHLHPSACLAGADTLERQCVATTERHHTFSQESSDAPLGSCFDSLQQSSPVDAAGTQPPGSDLLKSKSLDLVPKEVETNEKALVAQWVIDNIPLPPGAGIYLDAGSQCLAVWEKITEKLRDARVRLSVLTNNLLVVQKRTEFSGLPHLNTVNMQIAGDIVDPDHAALYGEVMQTQILSGDFRFSVVFIGASTVEFDERRFLLGYHAGDLERDAKALLFKCRAKVRVILATASKIGNSGGLAIDVAQIERLDTKAPIYLVTVEPEPNTAVARQYAEVKRTVQEGAIQGIFRKKGVILHWVTITRDGRNATDETFPKQLK